MIIDAMDIFYSGTVDAFCLVSSDSDYIRLATRIREQGIFVMGIGKKSTPRAFVKACDVFVYTENLVPSDQLRASSSANSGTNGAYKRRPSAKASQSAAAATPAANSPETVFDLDSAANDPLPLLRSAFDLATNDNGWTFLGTLGHHLRQLDPGFDSRTFGYRQLSLMIQAYPDVIETKEVKGSDGTSAIYARLRTSEFTKTK